MFKGKLLPHRQQYFFLLTDIICSSNISTVPKQQDRPGKSGGVCGCMGVADQWPFHSSQGSQWCVSRSGREGRLFVAATPWGECFAILRTWELMKWARLLPMYFRLSFTCSFLLQLRINETGSKCFVNFYCLWQAFRYLITILQMFGKQIT